MSLSSKIKSGELQLAYHGSAQTIDFFSEEKIGAGADLNSALGVFLTELPQSAIDYAFSAAEGGEGDECAFIHVVANPAQKVFSITDFDDFFGNIDDDPSDVRAGFAALRQSLLDKGFDAIDYEGLEDVIRVSLSPSKLTVIARLDPEQSEQLDALQFDSNAIFAKLMKEGWLLPEVASQTNRYDEGLQAKF